MVLFSGAVLALLAQAVLQEAVERPLVWLGTTETRTRGRRCLFSWGTKQCAATSVRTTNVSFELTLVTGTKKRWWLFEKWPHKGRKGTGARLRLSKGQRERKYELPDPFCGVVCSDCRQYPCGSHRHCQGVSRGEEDSTLFRLRPRLRRALHLETLN